eukprot:2415783-Amphidinium_carterae.1
MGAAAHAQHEPTSYLRWVDVAKAVRDFWLLVAPKLRDRPEAWPRIKLPKPVDEEAVTEGLAEPVSQDAQAPH